MDCLPIHQFCLNFLLTSKTYLKSAHPVQLSIANRDFPLPFEPESVVRLVCTNHKAQIMLLHSGLHWYVLGASPRCCALFARLLAPIVVHNIDG